jgi:hypothetical protein
MTIPSDGPPLISLYTGRSSFLQANQFLAASLLCAAGRCEIQSSEDIYDANGVMLWARQRRVGPALMAKLAHRLLAKPIELCVIARDPVSMLAISAGLDALSEQSPDFAVFFAPHRDEFLAMLKQLEFDHQELLLLSVLRFGERDRLTHALAVAAVAVEAGRWLSLGLAQLRQVLRAGLLHDVGMLYLPPAPAGSSAEVAQRLHPSLGAMCVAELTSCERSIAELIGQSHERQNGQGFPQGLKAPHLSRASQALGFAEAIADHLCGVGMGAQRAAVCCRVVPGEFAFELVSGAIRLTRSRAIGPICQVPAQQPAGVGRALRHLHGELARVLVLLSMSFGESDRVREAAAIWLDQVDPLLRALRYAGVEDALARGQDILPASPLEHGELAALHAEVDYRAQVLLSAMEFQCNLSVALTGSQLVNEARRLLKSACSPGAPTATL